MEIELTPAEKTDIRLFVLQRAILALIETHPDPQRFVQFFSTATAIAQAEHISERQATPAHRQCATAFAAELIDFSEFVVSKREKR